MIGGDFNQKLDITTRKRFYNYFKNILRQYNFYFLNYSPTRGKKIANTISFY